MAPFPPWRPDAKSREYDPNGIGKYLCDSLAILGFSLEDKVTERHIRRRYVEMEFFLPPDKNTPSETEKNKEEATQFFQLLNNAQAYLHYRPWYLRTKKHT